MNRYTTDELREKAKTSRCIAELMRALGYIPSTNITKKLRREMTSLGIDFSHFDSRVHVRDRRKHKLVDKVCPKCSLKFVNEEDGKESKVFCSRKCANSSLTEEQIAARSEKRRKNMPIVSPEEKERRALKRAATLLALQKPIVRRACDICDSPTNREANRYCSKKCAVEGLRLKVLSGKHKGWTSRNKLSYPERFFKKVLELNGLADQFSMNYVVQKRDLGIDCDSNFFLDFYFPELKLDLEIDGKQHKEDERAAHDKKRDASLKASGYHVYRIPWRSVNTDRGKKYMKNEIELLLLYIHNLRKCKIDFI